MTDTSYIENSLPTRQLSVKHRQKLLPPVSTSNPIAKSSQISNHKTPTLPPIESSNKVFINLPIIFALSKFLYI